MSGILEHSQFGLAGGIPFGHSYSPDSSFRKSLNSTERGHLARIKNEYYSPEVQSPELLKNQSDVQVEDFDMESQRTEDGKKRIEHPYRLRVVEVKNKI